MEDIIEELWFKEKTVRYNSTRNGTGEKKTEHLNSHQVPPTFVVDQPLYYLDRKMQ